ncbi:MAG: shikimate dehydrogenase family protein [Candidatus Zixiibacteriota bacterium]
MTLQYKFGLIGHHIGYSKSTEIFKAIFEIKKINGSFELFDLPPASFEKDFQNIVRQRIDGLSVTIPYKKRVMPLLDDITPVANSLEAVNSIRVNGQNLQGHNTDVFGFALPLKLHSNDLKQGSALILGCGGSAKAAVYSLCTDFEMPNFTVLGRSSEILSQFAHSLKNSLTNAQLHTGYFKNFFNRSKIDFSIVVNCTPLGGWNNPDESPLPPGFDWSLSKIYYDLNYNTRNKIVRRAADNGLTAINGAAMLVGQALRSFEIWSGQTAEFDEVYDRVFGESSRKSQATN